ncbi:MAG: KTSC domain-containing protein [Gammaproteobacteria bacterium]|nr:KTSC domain-containing protein [Gammaproteobacteria bacterium]
MTKEYTSIRFKIREISDSSAIRAAAYSSSSQILAIQYHTGMLWYLYGCPELTWSHFLMADSKGKFVKEAGLGQSIAKLESLNVADENTVDLEWLFKHILETSRHSNQVSYF